jgi:wyosine [tRNA(Phe)-imidazoG37] synthetase (radical SAM superfamily)
VDIVPAKVCTLDCVYCEVGRTTLRTIDRRAYVPMEEVLSEVRACLAQGVKPDCITITGSGEPTLSSDLGAIIDEIRGFSKIPVALITNGTLFYRQDVRDEASGAALVMPTLDAADAATFEAIHRPHPAITVDRVVEGLAAFRHQYKGQIWLEVFLVAGVNTSSGHIQRLKALIARVRPDKVQLNTAVRPTADPDVPRPTYAELQAIAKEIGPSCEIIADYSRLADHGDAPVTAHAVLALLRRRPCTVDDLAAGLRISRDQAASHLDSQIRLGAVSTEIRDGLTFYKA